MSLFWIVDASVELYQRHRGFFCGVCSTPVLFFSWWESWVCRLSKAVWWVMVLLCVFGLHVI